jgi:hypothetical protein
MLGMIFSLKCHACESRHPSIFLDSRFCGNDVFISRNVYKPKYM